MIQEPFATLPKENRGEMRQRGIQSRRTGRSGLLERDGRDERGTEV